jgi:hypothetical protein
MKVAWTETIGGVTYNRLTDGRYDPPLPADELAKRASRTPLFNDELRSGQVALGATDDTFFGGLPHFADTFGEEYAKSVYAEWDRQGISYTSRTNYNPFHAEYLGDPNGKVEGRADAKKRLERLQILPSLDPRETAPRLANDLIQECAADFAAENPDEFRKMDNHDVKAHMIEKHGAKK